MKSKSSWYKKTMEVKLTKRDLKLSVNALML